VAGASSWVAACSTTDTITYGDGDCVGAACQQAGASSSSSGGTTSATGGAGGSGGGRSARSSGVCTVDAGCAGKWADVYTEIIDPMTGCTSSLCHGSGQGGITLTPAMPHEAYLAFKDLMLSDNPGPVKKYIVPCDKAGSGMLCNTKLATGETNPFGTCGS